MITIEIQEVEAGSFVQVIQNGHPIGRPQLCHGLEILEQRKSFLRAYIGLKMESSSVVEAGYDNA